MRHRIVGLLGGRRRRSLLGGTLAIAAAGVFAISALAVHDLKFQLDGDVSASTTTNIGGTTQTVDWDTLFDASGNKKPLPAGFTASAFQTDFSTNANGSFSTSDNTTYATGSKDTLPITPGWQCNTDNNVLSKNDIMNAYATAFRSSTSRSSATPTPATATWRSGSCRTTPSAACRAAAPRRSPAITATATC